MSLLTDDGGPARMLVPVSTTLWHPKSQLHAFVLTPPILMSEAEISQYGRSAAVFEVET